MLIDITKRAGDWPDEPRLSVAMRRAVNQTIMTAGLPVHPQSELSIALSSDEEVRQLNKTYRGQDKATNVLSFAQFADLVPGTIDPPVPGPIGDIILAYETVLREAEEAGFSFADHVDHLVVHGLLHLYGYDHIVDEDAEIMETIEIRILAELGIADPYNELPEEPPVGAPVGALTDNG